MKSVFAETVLRCLLDVIIEPARGNATPMAQLIINPRVFEKVDLVHP